MLLPSLSQLHAFLLTCHSAAKMAQRQKAGSQFSLTQRPAASQGENENRARASGLPTSYTIAPRSTFDGQRGNAHRPLGSGGMEAFRKMTQKGKKRG